MLEPVVLEPVVPLDIPGVEVRGVPLPTLSEPMALPLESVCCALARVEVQWHTRQSRRSSFWYAFDTSS